jgi:formylglycine-generating enzyme required for sulfatase activity
MEHGSTSQQHSCCTPDRTVAVAESAFATQEEDVASALEGAGCALTRPGMAYVPGGTFLMGTDDREGFPEDGEGPVREVEVRPFWIDKRAVTNAQFAAFVQTTGYRTEAERFGWSFVFHLLLAPRAHAHVVGVSAPARWWLGVKGACWKHPEGPGSNLRGRENHPVVHISWHDAQAYCRWAGTRLPTEAEWEFAARGVLVKKRFAWGNELEPDGMHMCNVWQGHFPYVNTAEDGYVGTAPAGAFAPNGYGLYNMCGNVWEWCQDWFSATYHIHAPRDNPQGPRSGEAKVVRGGSYLCHRSYCNRYRVAARSANTPDSSTGNLGFRTVRDAN